MLLSMSLGDRNITTHIKSKQSTMPNTKKLLTSSKEKIASGKDLFKQLGFAWYLKVSSSKNSGEANSSTAFSVLMVFSNWKHKSRDLKLSSGDHQTNLKSTCKCKQNSFWSEGFEIPVVQIKLKYNCYSLDEVTVFEHFCFPPQFQSTSWVG